MQAPSSTTHCAQLAAGAAPFGTRLREQKDAMSVDFPWYPHDTLGIFDFIQRLVPPELDSLFAPRKKIADIGAADGDMAFYLEACGHECHIYDYGPTNMNGLRGAAAVKAALKSHVEIHSCDLDSQFEFARGYDFIFLMGILYHLKNPFFVLERLSYSCEHLLLSTRIARQFHRDGHDVSAVPAAYLLGQEEANNDATNFWVFTDAGLRRLLERTGWNPLTWHTIGDDTHSNPQDMDRDQRVFALLRSCRA